MTESTPGKPPESPEKKVQKRRHRATKLQLLSRSQIDGRSNAAKVFDRLVSSIEADLGGRSELSAIEIALIEAFAGAYVTLDNLNTRLLLGQEVPLSEHTAAVSAMVRVASRLGLQRRPRAVDVLPDPLTYAKQFTDDGDQP